MRQKYVLLISHKKVLMGDGLQSMTKLKFSPKQHLILPLSEAEYSGLLI